jgi:hypothetical protein
MFFRPKRPLTKLCERVSLRMIGNAAEADPWIARWKFDTGKSYMRSAKHPKKATFSRRLFYEWRQTFGMTRTK